MFVAKYFYKQLVVNSINIPKKMNFMVFLSRSKFLRNAVSLKCIPTTASSLYQSMTLNYRLLTIYVFNIRH